MDARKRCWKVLRGKNDKTLWLTRYYEVRGKKFSPQVSGLDDWMKSHVVKQRREFRRQWRSRLSSA